MTQRYHYARGFNCKVISFHCGCVPTIQFSIESSEAIIMAGTNKTGQFFTYDSSLLCPCHEECGLAWQEDSQQQRHQNIKDLTFNHVMGYCTLTLYTIRSCSPSLRVVPSYLISFTKDKANIFSDLSFAVEGAKEMHEEDREHQDGGGDENHWCCLFSRYILYSTYFWFLCTFAD